MIEREIAILSGFSIFITSLTFGTLLSSFMIDISWRIGALDIPQGELKNHRRPTATLGGIALFLSIFTGLFLLPITGYGISEDIIGWLHCQWRWLLIPLGCLFILLMGVKDDLQNIIPRNKLIFQIIAALMILYSGIFHVHYCDFFNVFSIPLGVLSVPFMFFWLVGSCNAVNFIDGMDGLASGVGIVLSLVLALMGFLTFQFGAALIALAVAGGLAGILMFNIRPALIFLGDSGSQLVGLILGMLTLEIATIDGRFALPTAGLILAVPVLDTFLAILRRFSKWQSPSQGDKAHIHHRLKNLGLSTTGVSALLWTASLICGLAGMACWYLEGITVGLAAFVFIAGLGYLAVRLGCLNLLQLKHRLTSKASEEQVAASRVPQQLADMWEKMKPLFEKMDLDHAELVLEKLGVDGNVKYATYQWSRTENMIAELRPDKWTRQIKLHGSDEETATLRIKTTDETLHDINHINWILQQMQLNFEKTRSRPASSSAELKVG